MEQTKQEIILIPIEVIEQEGLLPTSSMAASIISSFAGFLEKAKDWEAKAKAIIITDASQTDLMSQAREARLALKKIRTGAEGVRKQLKEDSVREGKAIDGVANIIKALIVPLEDHLEAQENFAERLQEAEKDKVNAERIAILAPFVANTDMYNLREMDETVFQEILKGAKLAKQQQIDGEVEAEKARKAKEDKDAEEREAQRLENERLKKEAHKREGEIAAAKKQVADARHGQLIAMGFSRHTDGTYKKDSFTIWPRALEHDEKDWEATIVSANDFFATIAKKPEPVEKIPLIDLSKEYDSALDSSQQDLVLWIEEQYREYVDYTDGMDKKPSAFGFKEYLVEQVPHETTLFIRN